MTLTVTPNPAAPSATVDVEGSGLAARTKYRLWREDPKYGRVGVTTNTGRTTRAGTLKVGITLSAYVGTQKVGCELYQSGGWKLAATVDVAVQASIPVPPDPTPIPPPVDPTRVVISDSATTAAHIRDFLGSHLGVPTALRTKQYAMGGTLDLAGFDGVDLDPVGCQMVFPVGVEIQLRDAKNIRIVSPATRWKMSGAVQSGFLPGHYYQRADGTTYGNEHMHAFAMEGSQHVELAGYDIDVVSGDGHYFGSYGTAMATDIHLHDFSVKQCGRMVFGLVAAKAVRVEDYTTRDVAYTIVDAEPEYYNAGAIQGVIDCIFRRGKAYGTVGAIHQGANFYDYAVAIQMGTPSVAGSIAPVIDGVTVDDLEVFDAPKGIFTRVGQGAYRIKNVTLNKCVGHAWPWPDPVFLIEGVDGGSIANCRSPKPAGGALWAKNDCTNFADGGGNVIA